MMHKVAYKKDEKYFKPHTVHCSCQFEGLFSSKDEAEAAIAQHLGRHGEEPNFSSERVEPKAEAKVEAKPEDRKEVKAGGPLF